LGTQAQAYSFDNTGNRLEKDDSGGSGPSKELSTFDAANRILSRGSQAYTSDADGNLLSDGARTYTWDSQNRLAQCVSTINGTITTSSYTYGADGLRRSATVAGVTTYYAYDGQSCVQEYKPGGNSHLNVSANYLMGPRGPECRADETDISEPFLSAAASSYFHQIGEGSGFNMSGATGYANSYPAFADGPRAHTSWYVYDGLGSVIGTVDGKSLAYTPGPKRDVYGIPRTSATLPTPHGFVGALGHPTDPTGLIYMRARYYDPQTGRFMSEDPGANGENWYVYADDNPVNEVDGNGKWAVPDLWIGGCIILLAVIVARGNPVLGMAIALIGLAVLLGGAEELYNLAGGAAGHQHVPVHKQRGILEPGEGDGVFIQNSLAVPGNSGLLIAAHQIVLEVLCESIGDD